MTALPLIKAESRGGHPCAVVGAMVRADLAKEVVLRIDATYLSRVVDGWWTERESRSPAPADLADLKLLISATLQPDHLRALQSVGCAATKISAVLLTHAFSVADKRLARLVHEAVTEIAGIVDIKYPYEDHKELFPKASDEVRSDWGKGLGVIRPHSDDLYEDQTINAMCLTVCKDTSSTPTHLWMLKDVVASLSDEELGVFALSEAIFLSGANVEGQVIEVRRPVLEISEGEGVGLRLDFRIDDVVGPRMRMASAEAQDVLDKMRERMTGLKPLCTHPTTGSVSVLANYKVLHGRSALRPVMLYDGEASRILFRSKGVKQVTL